MPSPYALVSLTELKAKLMVGGDALDDAMERCIDRATSMIEEHLDRQIVSRGELTEYHNPRPGMCDLYPGEWPIISIQQVCEDVAIPRTYGASTILMSDTDYERVARPAEKLRRLNSGDIYSWEPGRRTVRIKYNAGYATASVPAHIKGVALDLCALYYREDERKKQGISGASDATGNWTRFGPATLTPEMKSLLGGERREMWPMTWERVA